MVTSEKYAAAKKAAVVKTPENFMTIQMDATLVLPYKDGMAFVAALANAERFSSGWSDRRLIPITTDTVEIKPLSNKEYGRWRVAALLDITMDDLRQYEQSIPPP